MARKSQMVSADELRAAIAYDVLPETTVAEIVNAPSVAPADYSGIVFNAVNVQEVAMAPKSKYAKKQPVKTVAVETGGNDARNVIARSMSDLGTVFGVKPFAPNMAFLQNDPIMAAKDEALVLISEVDILDTEYKGVIADLACAEQQKRYDVGIAEKGIVELEKTIKRLANAMDWYRNQWDLTVKGDGNKKSREKNGDGSLRWPGNPTYLSSAEWYRANPAKETEFYGRVNTERELFVAQNCKDEIAEYVRAMADLDAAKWALNELVGRRNTVIGAIKERGARLISMRDKKLAAAQKLFDDNGFNVMAEELTLKGKEKK